LKIYVASPLGFSEVGRSFYPLLINGLESRGHTVIDPWTLTDEAQVAAVTKMRYGPARKLAFEKLNMIIAENNRRGIDDCNAMVAILDGTDVDSGTAAEIGYAYANHKLIHGYRGDFRLSADNEGGIVNLQVEYFIRVSGGRILRNLNDMLSYF